VPLSSSKLAQELFKVVDPKSRPQDAYAAGRVWASAYAVYAADAQASGIPPAPLEANERLLATALGAAFAGSRAAGQTANGIANALTVFWFSPPVVFGAGAVTAVGGTDALAQALQGTWAVNQASRADQVQAMRNVAVVVDAFTHTVLVTLPGPVTVPLT